MDSWLIYTLFALLCLLLELFFPVFYFFPIGLSFALTALFSLVFKDPVAQLVFLSFVTLGFFFWCQKYLRPMFNKNKIKTNSASLIGKEAKVMTAISPQSPGYVKVYGDEWKAYSKEQSFQVGTIVKVITLTGNSVVIEAISHEPQENSPK